jgi:hypothetical protein
LALSDHFPKGCIVVTPTGRRAKVMGYDTDGRLRLRYEGGDATDSVELAPAICKRLLILSAPVLYRSDVEEMKHYRLPNWGRSQWAALMEGCPSISMNPVYSMGRSGGDDDGYAADGEAGVAKVEQDHSTSGELPPIDEDDAEIVGAMVGQLWRAHQAILAERYSLKLQVDGDRLHAAVMALMQVKWENKAVTRRMQELIRRVGE